MFDKVLYAFMSIDFGYQSELYLLLWLHLISTIQSVKAGRADFDMYYALHTDIQNCIILSLSLELAIFSDLEDGYGINHEYMSHEDLYNSTVKKVAEAAPKLKALQEKLNPGGKDIWP